MGCLFEEFLVGITGALRRTSAFVLHDDWEDVRTEC